MRRDFYFCANQGLFYTFERDFSQRFLAQDRRSIVVVCAERARDARGEKPAVAAAATVDTTKNGALLHTCGPGDT